MKKIPQQRRVFYPQVSHPAVIQAFPILQKENLATCLVENASSADIIVGTVESLALPELPDRTFVIDVREGKLWIMGDRPRSVLAGVCYYAHHVKLGHTFEYPLVKTSPYLHRFILEDFPFHCYQPTGFDFHAEPYAQNLVALGYTTMECNRLSQKAPVGEYFDTYQITNPTPSAFVWTRWHEGVWEKDIIEANAAELRACIKLAVDRDLEPSITSFLPRPYPEAFFQKHPHLRGKSFCHQHMVRGNHPPVYRIDTDHPEGIEFYKTVYEKLLEANPEILHFNFWHGDLGTQFWPDGEGPLKRKEADRIIEFHQMFDGILGEKRSRAKVWINPWAMPENCLDEINDKLPSRVGYAVKDNTGVPCFCGTTPHSLPDLTIINSSIGDLPKLIKKLAAKKNREIFLCQYQDFSEDLDPILGVPHPMLAFRKFQSLTKFAPNASSTNWGVLSPEVTGSLSNQDVIREMTWGSHHVNCFREIFPLLVPEDLGQGSQEDIYNAWLKIDEALCRWPQFWGLRLQDGGLRFRWLIKPFFTLGISIPDEKKEYYLNHQIYHIDSPHPLGDFMNLSKDQAYEISSIYSGMVEQFEVAESLFAQAAARGGLSKFSKEWSLRQIIPTRWLKLFFRTYRNLLAFYSLSDNAPLEERKKWILLEIENTKEILEHLRSNPRSLIIASRGKWGQCFGPDIESDFNKKLEIMLFISKEMSIDQQQLNIKGVLHD